MTVVTILRHLYVNAPGLAGIYCLQARRTLAGIPYEGAWIELADGWASARVKNCTFLADGSVQVDLEAVKTDSPEMVAEEHQLVDSRDWSWLGTAPPRPAIQETP